MSKALAYTTFALLSSSLLLMMALAPVSNPVELNPADADRIGQASFFLDSVFTDMDRSLSIATRRALTGVTNYIVVEGEPLQDVDHNISEALVNGTMNGEDLNGTENASLTEWSSRVENIGERSGYNLKIEVEDYSFNSGNFEVEASMNVSARIEDPTTLASINRTRSRTAKVSVEGLEDPMLLLRSQGRYINQYRKCKFSKPAEKLFTGSQNTTGYIQGIAEVEPEVDLSSVPDKSDKVIVTDNINSFSSNQVNDFAGAVSSSEADNTDPYSNVYVFGTEPGVDPVSDIEQNQSLIINQDQIWESNFREMISSGCYVETDHGPDFLDRFENNITNDDGSGLATLIDITELPQELRYEESSVGYVYFGGSDEYGSLSEIKGVTDEHNWFRIDEEHINFWDIGEIAQ